MHWYCHCVLLHCSYEARLIDIHLCCLSGCGDLTHTPNKALTPFPPNKMNACLIRALQSHSKLLDKSLCTSLKKIGHKHLSIKQSRWGKSILKRGRLIFVTKFVIYVWRNIKIIFTVLILGSSERQGKLEMPAQKHPLETRDSGILILFFQDTSTRLYFDRKLSYN